MVAHVQEVSEGGIGEEAECAEGENGGDGEGGVVVVGIDGALGRDDGGDAADRGAHREQAGELGLQLEPAAEHGHDRDRDPELDHHQPEGYAAELEDVSEQEAGAEQHDARLEPEIVCGDAGAEDLRHADGVRDHQPDQDRPEHVLDVGQGEVVRLAVVLHQRLGQLPRVPDAEEQGHAGKQPQQAPGERDGRSLDRKRLAHFTTPP